MMPKIRINTLSACDSYLFFCTEIEFNLKVSKVFDYSAITTSRQEAYWYNISLFNLVYFCQSKNILITYSIHICHIPCSRELEYLRLSLGMVYAFVTTSNSFLITRGKQLHPLLNCFKKVQNLTCTYNACNRSCFRLPSVLLGNSLTFRGSIAWVFLNALCSLVSQLRFPTRVTRKKDRLYMEVSQFMQPVFLLVDNRVWQNNVAAGIIIFVTIWQSICNYMAN